MRILHTSDWHLGRQFERMPLIDDQRAFVEWLVDTVRTDRIDMVAIAGDVYDRSVPPEDAVELLDTAIAELRNAGAIVALIPGNHDNSTRVGFGARAFGVSGIHVRGSIGRDTAGAPILVEFTDGPLAIVPLPFLDPGMYFTRDESGEYPDLGVERTHEGAMRDALRATREQVGNTRSLLLAHAFVAGNVEVSDSEKTLRVGGTDRVAVEVFEGFSYTALGHIHRPQTAGSDAIAYSGSPLPYSFSEEGAKSVRLVEMAPDGSIEVEVRAVPVGRGVATIEGTLEELLSGAEHEDARSKWVRAKLTDDEVRTNAMAQLRKRFPHAVALEYTGLQGRSRFDGPNLEEMADLTPEQVADGYWADVRGDELEGPKRDLLVGAVREVMER
ncbi:MAG: exonuclease SbcCD subunit D [Actinomycetes bacterium]